MVQSQRASRPQQITAPIRLWRVVPSVRLGATDFDDLPPSGGHATGAGSRLQAREPDRGADVSRPAEVALHVADLPQCRRPPLDKLFRTPARIISSPR
jgi:hypothetical protein